MMRDLFLGIDVGTQGVRVAAMDAAGKLAAEAEVPFGADAAPGGLPAGWFEQRPEAWLDALGRCLAALSAGRGIAATRAISVTSTSGTVVPAAADGSALCPAIMYNDSRSADEARAVQAAGAPVAAALGYVFGSSFGLPKILWLRRHRPDVYERTARFLSPTDFVVAWLCGRSDVSDPTNMLKSGYDLLNDRWPDFLGTLDLDAAKLPDVVPSGSVVAPIRPEVARRFGLEDDTVVCAGMTDGCASQVSAGAVRPGQWCTTIGTTLVIKGVSSKLVLDPLGRVYSHRHPEGYWLPGGASNTGADCLKTRFGQRTEVLSAGALAASPSGVVTYPLMKRGERFPFVSPEAEGFVLDDPAGAGPDELRRFASHLEGVAFVERLSYETLEALGLAVGPEIFTTGGGARSTAWIQIRADVLGRSVLKPEAPLGAVGAAILAASRTAFRSLSEAASAMVRIESRSDPRPAFRGAYEAPYRRFVGELRRRGYLREGGGA